MVIKTIYIIKENNKQNIKRRVYDALNVLIAANVLKKSGKTVHIDENTGLIGKYCKSNMTQEKLKFHQKLVNLHFYYLRYINPLKKVGNAKYSPNEEKFAPRLIVKDDFFKAFGQS